MGRESGHGIGVGFWSQPFKIIEGSINNFFFFCNNGIAYGERPKLWNSPEFTEKFFRHFCLPKITQTETKQMK